MRLPVVTLALLLTGHAVAQAERGIPLTEDDRKVVSSLKITILSTMLTDTVGIGEWGFAALVEADGNRVLFDTGHRPNTVLENAKELGVELADIEDVVLSHNHVDHTGGLLSLRKALSKQSPDALRRVHVARGIFLERGSPRGFSARMAELRTAYEKTGGTFIVHDAVAEIMPGVWLTGPVPRVHPEKNWNPHGRVHTDEGVVVDEIPESQSLVLETREGLVMLSGCGHAGMINTMDHARNAIREREIVAAIGGFHLLRADDEHLGWTAGKMRELGVRDFIGAHCTGINAVHTLREQLGLPRSDAVVGAVGASFELGKGIDPGILAK